jgi:hypothetical protein
MNRWFTRQRWQSFVVNFLPGLRMPKLLRLGPRKKAGLALLVSVLGVAVGVTRESVVVVLIAASLLTCLLVATLAIELLRRRDRAIRRALVQEFKVARGGVEGDLAASEVARGVVEGDLAASEVARSAMQRDNIDRVAILRAELFDTRRMADSERGWRDIRANATVPSTRERTRVFV